MRSMSVGSRGGEMRSMSIEQFALMGDKYGAHAPATPQAPIPRLVDYEWYSNEDAGPVFWATVNRFCADCVETGCPVLAAIKAANANRERLHLDAEATAVQTACPFVEEYHEADGVVAIRRRRAA